MYLFLDYRANVDMQGYELDIESDVERRNLIKDAKFYNLRHLTEFLIPAKVYSNPFRGNASEILLNIQDFRPSNCRAGWVENQPYGWLEYKRPHDVDKQFHDLVVQIDNDGVVVGSGKVLLINRQALKAVKCLKDAAEGRKTEPHNLPFTSQTEIAIRVDIPNDCCCIIDGEMQPASIFEGTLTSATGNENGDGGTKKRKLSEVEGEELGGKSNPTLGSIGSPKAWILKRSMWRVKIRGQHLQTNSEGSSQSVTQPTPGGKRFMVLVGIKLEGWSRESQFAKGIEWL